MHEVCSHGICPGSSPESTTSPSDVPAPLGDCNVDPRIPAEDLEGHGGVAYDRVILCVDHQGGNCDVVEVMARVNGPVVVGGINITVQWANRGLVDFCETSS